MVEQVLFRTRGLDVADRNRYGMGVNIGMSLVFAGLTAIMAKVSFVLPWTPVPITGQTYAVLLSAVVLGRWGGASQAIYAVAAFAGLPVLAGPGAMTGPTAGYVAGFPVAAFLVGLCVERYQNGMTLVPLTVLLTAANCLILSMGTLWLFAWYRALDLNITFDSVLFKGFIPFIPGAAVKTVLAACTGRLLVSKSAGSLKKY